MTGTKGNLDDRLCLAKRHDPESNRTRVITAWVLLSIMYLLMAVGIYLIWEKANPA
jgi:hypothetical protein